MWDYAVVVAQLCLFVLVLVATLLLAHAMRTETKRLATAKTSSPRKKTTTKSSSSSAPPSPEPFDKSSHVFFWKVDGPYGYLSQWYHSPFTTRIHLPGAAAPSTEALTFLTAEHYMMACKALLFNDRAVFDQILARGSTNADMTKVKALGREVRDFSDEVWKQHREEIVLNGSLAKFGDEANRELRERLLGTGDKVIVEASPRDRVWGIGFGEKRALEVKERWGLNLLGVALMKTRDKLREGEAEGSSK